MTIITDRQVFIDGLINWATNNDAQKLDSIQQHVYPTETTISQLNLLCSAESRELNRYRIIKRYAKLRKQVIHNQNSEKLFILDIDDYGNIISSEITTDGSVNKFATSGKILKYQGFDQETIVIPNDGSGIELTTLTFVQSPPPLGMGTEINCQVFHESGNNATFYYTRESDSNPVEILADSVNAANDKWSGIATVDYDANNSTTPQAAIFSVVDKNPWQEETTYRLMLRSNDGTATTFVLGRSINSVGSSANENCVSKITTSPINL